jgi:hypothetical protein
MKLSRVPHNAGWRATAAEADHKLRGRPTVVLKLFPAQTLVCRLRNNGQMEEVSFSNVAPVIAVSELDRALRRYRILGFRTRAYDGPDRYGFVERDGVELHLSEAPEHDRTRDGSEIYLYVSDADALYASWSSSGVKGRFIPPHDTPYGLREFAFVDRDGTAHRVGSPLPEVE